MTCPRFLLALLLCSFAAVAAPGDVLLDSQFNEPPDPKWQPVNGMWYYEDGAYCETTDGSAPLWSTAGDPAWTDYAVDTDMKALDSGGSLFICARWVDADNHYELEYQGRGGAVLLNKVVFGDRVTLAQRSPVVDIGGGKQPYAHFRFEVTGSLLRVIVNDEVLLQAVDDAFPAGRVGLGENQRRGVWDYVKVTALAPAGAADIARRVPAVIRTTPRTSFIRPRGGSIVYRLHNGGDQPMTQVAATVRLVGVLRVDRAAATLAPGADLDVELPVDAAILRAGAYQLKLEASVGGVPVLQQFEPLHIQAEPNPQRMEVINWTGGDAGIETHGFTTAWQGLAIAPEFARPDLPIPVAASDPALIAAGRAGYNKLLARGLLSGFQLHNIGSRLWDVPEGLPIKAVNADGSAGGTNPNHPAVRAWGEAWLEGALKTFAGYDGLTTANLNSEWDRAFDYSDVTVAMYRKRFGKEPPRFGFPLDRKTANPEWLPRDGVVADDNPYYQYLLWWWAEGQGWTAWNARMHDIIKAHDPNILTISEPTARIPALYGKAAGCDVAQDWSYSWPSPRSILMTADFLVATKRHNGQKISHDVQFLWKRGWVGPDDMAPSPDVIRECMWMNMSRPFDLLFMWGTMIVVQDEKDPRDGCNPATYEAFGDFAHEVIEPYGPMIRRTAPAPRPVAVLLSAASRLFVEGWRWGPGIHAMNYYDALQAARVPTDIVLESDLTDGTFAKRNYDVLILPHVGTLPAGAHAAVVAFANAGGHVIADQHLGPAIPGAVIVDADFGLWRAANYSSVAQGKPDKDAAKALMVDFITRLRAAIDGMYTPELVLPPETEALYNVLDANGRRLFVLINDRRTFGEWAGRFRTIHDAGVPQEVTATIPARADEVVWYDLLAHRAVGRRGADGNVTIARLLPPAGGTYLAAYPEPLTALTVAAVPGDLKTTPVTVTLRLALAAGTPAPGLQPVHVRIEDANGVRTEYSRYVCLADGTGTFTFRPAVNDVGGSWRLVATDLTAGLVAETYVEIPRDAHRFAEVTLDPNAANFDLEHWDRD